MSESTDQMALFDLLNRLAGTDGSGRPLEGVTARLPLLRWVTHFPAGEKRDKATAAKLQRMGLRAGVPDVLCFTPNQLPIGDKPAYYYVGCVIERKAARGVVSIEQRAWLKLLESAGWFVVIDREWTKAARLLITWVGGDPDQEMRGL